MRSECKGKIIRAPKVPTCVPICVSIKKKSKANIIPFTAVRGHVQIVYITEANDHILSRGRTDATPAQNTQSLLLLRPWHVTFTSDGV